ncbi:MAG: hypothetical protein DHS20C11_14840 [Lysobacteraceae bacterium]|nr:MAG: hypothetical protein DHS20C11_14840 [Xanthomonadaceae bacterium]
MIIPDQISQVDVKAAASISIPINHSVTGRSIQTAEPTTKKQGRSLEAPPNESLAGIILSQRAEKLPHVETVVRAFMWVPEGLKRDVKNTT